MRILIAEDETIMRRAEAAYLEQAGHTVIEAADGNKALQLFQTETPDLAVLDITLPGIDGIALCEQIRKSSNIPIVMVTARTTDLDELLALTTGADDYIRKPFNPSLLVARIETLLRRVHKGKVTRGPFVADPVTRIVLKDGQRCPLTTAQFNIFFDLISHAGEVRTRQQIIDSIHADDVRPDVIFDRTVDAHIKAIRKVIEATPAEPKRIQTVIGMGYRFIA